ncbi:hypothetical protein NNJEOMEG_03841 [Fundidesulfovibrio magnetotacticus]|uniref:TadE-like domain-containing protein n=1 Tax=Fundidesulfovibrio magnetotacticus TaxID=2730080 RepID=A0A6V8M0H8_9BACT|nr:TadE/TadG family type IV pilus assembly protein [Fundidesulfovibrio magnetotacticus]GFK95968.1 hypothetical protein NNJEOMEG_03841 [Fundidesulfovibrio magnetotacticus]
MTVKLHTTPGRDSGSTSVEMALILLPLLLLLVGGVEAGRYYWTRHVVAAAAAEGARLAILNGPTDAEVAARARRILVEGGVSQAAGVTVSARQANQPVTVRVDLPYAFFGLGGLVPAFAAVDSISITSMMVHQP